MKYHSQWNQDQFVYENYFKDLKSGYFVDVGAHDGIDGSNSLFFESIGWKGLCIEPIYDVYKNLKQNRKCECVNGCVYSNSGFVEFTRLKGYTEMLSGITNCYPPEHIKRIENEINVQGGSMEIIKVPCYTLTELLLNRNITHVNFLSIDTEGSELEILKGIDFNLITIDVITVEINYANENSRILQDHLLTNGFKYVTDVGGDKIFTNLKFNTQTNRSVDQ